MAAQSTERGVTVEVSGELIRLMVPDMDPQIVRLVLRRMAHGTLYGRAGREGQREGRGEDQARVLQEQVELLALVRDAGIDQAQLCAFLGIDGPDARRSEGTEG
jgi:hypothetical protein